MKIRAYERALELLNAGKISEADDFLVDALAAAPEDPLLLYARGRLYYLTERYAEAADVLSEAAQADPCNEEILYAFAVASRSIGSIRALAAARDVLVPLAERDQADDRILRAAAETCSWVGPEEKAVAIWRRLANRSADASVHFALSEALAVIGQRRAAVESLRRAATIDPQRFERLLAEADFSDTMTSAASVSHVRYSFPRESGHNLKKAIDRLLMQDFAPVRFVSPQTSFFTIGSSFASAMARRLSSLGFRATCLPWAENLNTTFAIRYFFDWLAGIPMKSDLSDRLADMVPAGFSRSSISARLREADVFILTVGVAATFFDRRTGEFVPPRPTALSIASLAETHDFRTTTVSENIENIAYIYESLRKVDSEKKLVLIISPLPQYLSYDQGSPLVADCLSKSVIRVAANEVVARFASEGNVMYFPALEAFRWLGSHIDIPLYGSDDGAAFHASEQVIEALVDVFLDKAARLEINSLPSGNPVGPPLRLRALFSPHMIDRATPAYFYGSGQMGQGLHRAMGEGSSWNFCGFIDSYRSGVWQGQPILDLETFRSRYKAGDQIVITSGSVDEISTHLASVGVSEVYDANPWWKARAFPDPALARNSVTSKP